MQTSKAFAKSMSTKLKQPLGLDSGRLGEPSESFTPVKRAMKLEDLLEQAKSLTE